ncbi:Carbonic anhydrase 14 [Anabarilius grahami]|uniref:Carbonic anhydrase 14 n=1 Tax=Anabarilius grahami TaxID=495550 RepID=A0A3N0Y8K4_ANAGA|nr:Carbonic anhydrase 14 [Anabarilius grahami]
MGLAGLPWHYSAVQLHLHWGNGVGVATGSEHTINGQSTSAELHIVHYNAEVYANMSQAKTQENGLAVLGILIEAGEEINQAYGSILNYLGRIRYAGMFVCACQKVAIPAFDIQSLLPDNLSQYFRYNGSLTTPPCHQSVLWTIFNERVKISHSQFQWWCSSIQGQQETLSPAPSAGNSSLTSPSPTIYQVHSITGKPLSRKKISRCVGPLQLRVGILHVEDIHLLVLEDSTADVVLGCPWLEQHSPTIS